jgi:hypothetical protein
MIYKILNRGSLMFMYCISSTYVSRLPCLSVKTCLERHLSARPSVHSEPRVTERKTQEEIGNTPGSK